MAFGTTPGTEWQSGVCAPALRWRQLADGRIELEQDGFVKAKAWPKEIDMWRDLIRAAASRHGVPANWVAGIMGIESGGKINLVSYAGAGGLMALMPATAAGMESKLGLPHRPFAEIVADNALNIELGVAYLKDRLDAYQGQFPLAAIAYNAGSVRCGTGSLCIPPGQPGCVRTPCPPNAWGAIMDCWLQKDGSLKSSDYPRRATEYANSALEHGFSASGEPIPIPSPDLETKLSTAAIVALGIGAFGGWWLVKNHRRLRRAVA